MYVFLFIYIGGMFHYLCNITRYYIHCCIRCGPDEERILDVDPREDGARNSG